MTTPGSVNNAFTSGQRPTSLPPVGGQPVQGAPPPGAGGPGGDMVGGSPGPGNPANPISMPGVPDPTPVQPVSPISPVTLPPPLNVSPITVGSPVGLPYPFWTFTDYGDRLAAAEAERFARFVAEMAKLKPTNYDEMIRRMKTRMTNYDTAYDKISKIDQAQMTQRQFDYSQVIAWAQAQYLALYNQLRDHTKP